MLTSHKLPPAPGKSHTMLAALRARRGAELQHLLSCRSSLPSSTEGQLYRTLGTAFPPMSSYPSTSLAEALLRRYGGAKPCPPPTEAGLVRVASRMADSAMDKIVHYSRCGVQRRLLREGCGPELPCELKSAENAGKCWQRPADRESWMNPALIYAAYEGPRAQSAGLLATPASARRSGWTAAFLVGRASTLMQLDTFNAPKACPVGGHASWWPMCGLSPDGEQDRTAAVGLSSGAKMVNTSSGMAAEAGCPPILSW